MRRAKRIGYVLALVVGLAVPALAADVGPLRAGAARVNIMALIDPAATRAGTYAHERLHVRAIVLDNGQTRAALIGADLGNIGEDAWSLASKQITEALQCPPEQIVMSATHTYSAGAAGSSAGTGVAPQPAALAAAMTDAVRQARMSLQPARVGFDTAFSYLRT